MTVERSGAHDARHFRNVLGHLPTGVVLVTGVDADGKPRGFCVGSLTSVSLDPPLILFCPAKTSSTWPLIAPGGKFCVNVLSEHQAQLSSKFAGSDEDRFAGLPWQLTDLGSPRLDDVLAWMDCTIADVHEGGDHLIVTGAVNSLGTSTAPDDSRPLVFFKGALGGFRDASREVRSSRELVSESA